jgi:hypothetical protein
VRCYLKNLWGLRTGSTPATRSGRLAFALSSFLSEPVDTVKGAPLRNETIGEIVQPFWNKRRGQV